MQLNVFKNKILKKCQKAGATHQKSLTTAPAIEQDVFKIV